MKAIETSCCQNRIYVFNVKKKKKTEGASCTVDPIYVKLCLYGDRSKLVKADYLCMVEFWGDFAFFQNLLLSIICFKISKKRKKKKNTSITFINKKLFPKQQEKKVRIVISSVKWVWRRYQTQCPHPNKIVNILESLELLPPQVHRRLTGGKRQDTETS